MRSHPNWFCLGLLIFAIITAYWFGSTTPTKIATSQQPSSSSPASPTSASPTSASPTSPTANLPIHPTPPIQNPKSEIQNPAPLAPTMSDPSISAEIQPQPNQVNQAARLLQSKGFRILAVGDYISVQAPRSLWESTFNLTFEEKTKPRMQSIPSSTTTYLQPTGAVQMPDELKGAIVDVLFVQPPELF